MLFGFYLAPVKVSSILWQAFSVGRATQQVHRLLPSVPIVQAHCDDSFVAAFGDDGRVVITRCHLSHLPSFHVP